MGLALSAGTAFAFSPGAVVSRCGIFHPSRLLPRVLAFLAHTLVLFFFQVVIFHRCSEEKLGLSGVARKLPPPSFTTTLRPEGSVALDEVHPGTRAPRSLNCRQEGMSLWRSG